MLLLESLLNSLLNEFYYFKTLFYFISRCPIDDEHCEHAIKRVHYNFVVLGERKQKVWSHEELVRKGTKSEIQRVNPICESLVCVDVIKGRYGNQET